MALTRTDTSDGAGRITEPLTIAAILAAVKLLIWAFAGSGYGYFRDELYFLACADHLAWGYPDHAPLSVFIVWFSRAILGDSLYAIHFFPTLAGALKIFLTGLIVRELGGGRLAVLIGCLCVLAAPIFLSLDLILSMNVYEPIFWMGCALCYIWAVKRGDPRFWLMFGAFAGLGTMNKHSMVFFGIAFVAGLLLTRDRRVFASPYIWGGGVIAFLLFLPNLIWQYENNWATLELLRNVQATGKNVVLSPFEFIWQQIVMLLPLTAVVWGAGLYYYLFDREGKKFRTLGATFLATLSVMIVLKAKSYYLAPVYPILFAAGGVFWERFAARFRYGRPALLAYAAVLFIFGAVFLPFSVPILPVDTYLAYQNKLGITPPKTEVGHTGPLPQHFGDRFGWEEMTAKVAGVYNSLPDEERRKAAIFAGNYGEAGAVDHFGGRYGLPKAISPHQSYFLWGPRNYDGSVMIILGGRIDEVRKHCNDVEERDAVGGPYAMGEEHFNIIVCRGSKRPLAEVWPSLKHWN